MNLSTRVPQDEHGFVTLGTGTDRKRARRRLPAGIERMLGVVLLVGLWQLASSVGLIDEQTLAGPATVVHSGWRLLQDGTLRSAIWVSLGRVVEGVAIGVPLATVLALVAGLSRLGEDTVDATDADAEVPADHRAATAHRALVRDREQRQGLVDRARGGVPRVHQQVRRDPGDRSETLRARALGRPRSFRHDPSSRVTPARSPASSWGCGWPAAVAWLILVFAEQINATNGIGFLMIHAQEFFRTDIIVVGLAVYAVLGLASDALIRFLEKRALRWRASW